MKVSKSIAWSLTVGGLLAGTSLMAQQHGQPTTTPTTAHDPGPRTVAVGAGQPLAGLSSDETEYFLNGLSRFIQTDSVTGSVSTEPGLGLGPGFNSNSCVSCHAQPGIGGSSPSVNAYPNIGPNPQIAVASDDGARNSIPFFITSDGPVREARFPFVVNSNGRVTQTPDGGVHNVFTIAGRFDAPQCNMQQPNFEQAEQQNNLIFRIPTPTFGAGLIENVPDATILANMNSNSQLKQSLNISGHPNTSGNDGTITRFGWKAQNKSLEVFAGEAYNVEMGVTNELFTSERSAPASCMYNQTPEDTTNFTDVGRTNSERHSSIRRLHAVSGSAYPVRAGNPGKSFRCSPSETGKLCFRRCIATCATRRRCRPEHRPSPRL